MSKLLTINVSAFFGPTLKPLGRDVGNSQKVGEAHAFKSNLLSKKGHFAS